MVDNKKIDFFRNEFSFIGRMYSRNDLSEFQIQLYQNENDKFTGSICELRRTSGDSFVHEDFFNEVTKKLSESKLIILNDNQNGFGGLEPLSLKDFILDTDDDEVDDDDDEITFDTDVDMTDDNTSI